MSESLKCRFPFGTSWPEITPVNPRCQAPNPKMLCASLNAALPLGGNKAALTISTSLHSLPTASSQDFRSRNYRLWRALWKPPYIPVPLFRAPPRAALLTPCLRGQRSMERVAAPLLPGALPGTVDSGSLEALLLELEAPLQSADRGAGPCSHGYMPQTHGLGSAAHRLRLSGHYLRLHYDSTAGGAGKARVLEKIGRIL